MLTSKSRLFALTALSGLLLLGAGCNNLDVAVPAREANGDSAIRMPETSLMDTANQAPIQVNEADSAGPAAEALMPTNESMSNDQPAVPTSFPGVMPAADLEGLQARIATDKGEIVFDILGDEGPNAASNFVTLAHSGFYDGLTFHRVVQGFVIQGGDPLGNGTGGPGYKFADDPVNLPYEAGMVAMANSGPDTNGSQFFVVLEDQPTLPPSYSIFGRVTAGMDVVKQIAVGDVMNTVVIEAK
jgi:cyclophilin family peptidyl-prolyl cis-trans isomerase